MASIKVYQFPRELQTIVMYARDGALNFARENFDKYRTVFECEHEGESGQLAAEAMFELFSSPSEESDKFRAATGAKMMAVGDVVEVDGKKFVCMPCSWREM